MSDEPTIEGLLRRTYTAVAFEIPDASPSEVPFRARRSAPVRRTRRVAVAVGLAACLVILGAVATVLQRHHSSRPLVVTTPATNRPRPTTVTRPQPSVPVRARVVLPSHTMVAGTSMTGHVVIDNRTKHALVVTGCISLFQVALSNATVRPAPLWPLCAQRIVIPTGTSSYPVTVFASYLECSSTGQPPTPTRLCEQGPPALPVGSYQAVLFQNGVVAPTPPPIPVRVVARTTTP